jgi:hypothetical protein
MSTPQRLELFQDAQTRAEHDAKRRTRGDAAVSNLADKVLAKPSRAKQSMKIQLGIKRDSGGG